MANNKTKLNRLSLLSVSGTEMYLPPELDEYLNFPISLDDDDLYIMNHQKNIKDARYWVSLKTCSFVDVYDHDYGLIKNEGDVEWLKVGDWEAVRQIEALRIQYDNGDTLALLDAISWCARSDAPMPNWVKNNYTDSYAKILRGDVKTLDEAFGRPISKGANLNALKKKRKLALEIWSYIKIASENGRAIDDELFEEAGKEFNIGKTLAGEYYAHAKVFLPDVD
jgi:hypothetical protein